MRKCPRRSPLCFPQEPDLAARETDQSVFVAPENATQISLTFDDNRLASMLFGFINQIAAFETTPVFGEVALLISAIIMIRILPQGITGRFLRRSV